MGLTQMNLPKQEGREVHTTRGGLLHPEYDKSRIINDVGLIQLLKEVSLTGEQLVLVSPPSLSLPLSSLPLSRSVSLQHRLIMTVAACYRRHQRCPPHPSRSDLRRREAYCGWFRADER